MTAISFQEASIRSEIPLGRIHDLAGLGYFKVLQNPFTQMIDSESFDTYLANKQPPENGQKEMIIRKKEKDTMFENYKAPEIKYSETAPTPGGRGADKIKKFDWKTKGCWGEPREIPKDKILIDYRYQRPQDQRKVVGIASDFDRVAFGRLMVSERSNGDIYSFDGGHRWAAIMSRSDITTVPCDVYHFNSLAEEAEAFSRCNRNRKPPQIVHTFKADLVAKNKEALYIKSVLDENKIKLRKALIIPRSFKSIGLCYRMAKFPDDFETTMSLVSELCENDPIHERLVGGIFYLSQNLMGGINDPKLKRRILLLGPIKLVHAANDASYHLAHGGSKVWATGMLKLINKGLKYPHKFQGENA